MTEENIYTIALKYGVDNLNTGVTYNQLIAHLKSKLLKGINEIFS